MRLKWQDVPLDKAMVAELQAEPWMTGGSVASTTLKKTEKSMDVRKLKQNILMTQKNWFYLDLIVGSRVVVLVRKIILKREGFWE